GRHPPEGGRRLGARRQAGRRGRGPGGHLPVAEVVLYSATGCPLCAAARRIVGAARDELGFELREVTIDGVPELEAAYREWIPVVEIGGRRRFTYHVHPDALRRAVLDTTS